MNLVELISLPCVWYAILHQWHVVLPNIFFPKSCQYLWVVIAMTIAEMTTQFLSVSFGIHFCPFSLFFYFRRYSSPIKSSRACVRHLWALLIDLSHANVFPNCRRHIYSRPIRESADEVFFERRSKGITSPLKSVFLSIFQMQGKFLLPRNTSMSTCFRTRMMIAVWWEASLSSSEH